MSPASLSRREFLRVSTLVGGGLAINLLLPETAEAEPVAKPSAQPFTPNPFITITPDGLVTLAAPNPDAGQGVKTALPMIIAEELGADFSQVQIDYGTLNPRFVEQAAGGSMSVRQNFLPLRQAGAVARTLLIQAAAAAWRVPAAECTAANSRVSHRPTGRSFGFGELATRAAQLPLPDENTVTLKPPSDHTLIGRRIGGIDNPAIVAGRLAYGLDQLVPGMVHAVYVKCPVFGGRVVSANLDDLKRLPGVLAAFAVAGTDDYFGLLPGVAIVADSTWSAFKARRALEVAWDEGPGAGQSSTGYEQAAASLAAGRGTVLRDDGNVDAALASAAVTAAAAYHYPYLHHATLEPMNALAVPLPDGGMEIVAPTQMPDDAREVAARVLGLAKDQVKVRFTRIGGGFGRRLTNDFVAEAAVIARQVGRPVKLTTLREDDTQHGHYRPAGWHFLKAGVDSAGRVVAWHNHFVTVGLGTTAKPNRAAELNAKELPGRLVPNFRVEQSIIGTNVPTSWLRAPGSNGIAFAMQGFIDELAHAAHRDPLQFRLDLLGPDRVLPGTGKWDPPYDLARMKAVLRLAAEKAGWGRPLPRGSGQGIAFHFSHGGYVAEVAEVTVTREGALMVSRVTAAVDVGPIINASGAETQVQGAIIDGLSGAWLQEITLEAGRVAQSNFHDYPLLRIDAAPARIDVHFLITDNPPTGLGEPALPPLAPAVSNAIFAATGRRIRRLPLRRTDLQWT